MMIGKIVNNRTAILIVLFSTVIYNTNWGMLTVRHNIPQKRLEKINTDEKFTKEKDTFLQSFGSKSMEKTALEFRSLSTESQRRILPRLNKMRLQILSSAVHYSDVSFKIFTLLLDGNQQMAYFYKDKPIGEIVENYARAKEWGKVGDLSIGHLMSLKNKEIKVLRDWILGKYKCCIRKADIFRFADALQTLQKNDPKGLERMKKLAAAAKLYPLVPQRFIAFCNTPGNMDLKWLCYASALLGVTLMGTRFGHLRLLGLSLKRNVKTGAPYSFILAKHAPSVQTLSRLVNASCGETVLFFLGAFMSKCINYRNNLANNIIPNQPTVIDVLQARNYQFG
jgi:hypothetical protein